MPAGSPYVPPRLEPLGAWSALTLQQSIPIGPDEIAALGPPYG